MKILYTLRPALPTPPETFRIHLLQEHVLGKSLHLCRRPRYPES